MHNDVAGARREADLEPAGFWREYADALARQREGDRPAADAALRAFMDKYSYGGPFQIAIVCALRKDPDGVFKWLDRSFEVRDSGLTQLFVSPFLIDYRNDPRFISVAAKLGVDSRQGGN